MPRLMLCVTLNRKQSALSTDKAVCINFGDKSCWWRLNVWLFPWFLLLTLYMSWK